MEYPIHSKEQLYKICENIINEWTEYFTEELKSYGLDFSFENPVMHIDTGNYYSVKFLPEDAINWDRFGIVVWLYGHKLPDDVIPNDADVLSRFLKQCAVDFVNLKGKDFIKDYNVTVDENYPPECRLTPNDTRSKIVFLINLCLNYSGN